MMPPVDVKIESLSHKLQERLGSKITALELNLNEITINVQSGLLLEVCQVLKTHPDFMFQQLMDVCGVDYLDYGVSEWSTNQSTTEGFSRGVERLPEQKPDESSYKNGVREKINHRFAVIYHLLSIHHNHRIRIKTYAEGDPPRVPSVYDIWNSSNWYEREAFDLFGILFENHPDLRRLLTDYGFIGHPFRKDFPLIGTVEMRYSANHERVIYEPVSIEPRTLVPKVIREDNRYPNLIEELTEDKNEGGNNV